MKDIKEKINLVLAVMTVKQRRRYRLYLEGKTHKEIADIENVSRPVITKCLKGAKKRAKRKLKWVQKGYIKLIHI